MTSDSEINILAAALNKSIVVFCAKADKSEKLTHIWDEFVWQLTNEDLVNFALYLFPRFEAYSKLMMAYWAGGYSSTVKLIMDKHLEQTEQEITRRLKVLGVSLDDHFDTISKWFDNFKTDTALHAVTSVPLIETIRTLLSDYLPAAGRSQAEIDAALSKIGLPTSTENEGS